MNNFARVENNLEELIPDNLQHNRKTNDVNMSHSRRSSVDLSAGVVPRSRRSSVDYSADLEQFSRRASVDYSSGVGPLGLPLRPSVDTGFNSSVGTNSRRPSVDFNAGVGNTVSW